MTITEYSKLIKEENEKFIIFIKYGKFYRCFGYDAYIIHYLFSYKLTSRETIGFPIENITKVLSFLKNNNISTIVVNNNINYIKYECPNNKYNYFLNKSLSYYNNSESKKILINLIEEKIAEDYSLIYKIKDFVENL